MNKKALHFSSGFVAGVISCAMAMSGAFAYAAGITAEASRNRFIVNGEEVAMQAYKIDGYNYFKLRDLGDALGFGVAWDGENHQVIIDTSVSHLEDIQVPKVENNDDFELGYSIPSTGSIVRCSDGYDYEIKDVSKYDNNSFAEGKLPELPAEKESWARMPKADMPESEARHYSIGGKEYMFVRNLTETKRMLYTLYEAIEACDETWQNGSPVLFSSGNSKVTVKLSIKDDGFAQSFWPWRASEITKIFDSCPPGHYEMEAWDVYIDGVFQHTEYKIAVI
ncbi:MAG: hypothetical protein IJJ75_03460 [Firmicutes bacterium]|nr:hypothetical protein [Bacillota bacterium]